MRILSNHQRESAPSKKKFNSVTKPNAMLILQDPWNPWNGMDMCIGQNSIGARCWHLVEQSGNGTTTN